MIRTLCTMSMSEYIDDMAEDIDMEDEIMAEMEDDDEYEPDDGFVVTGGVTTDQKQRDEKSRNELRQQQIAQDDRDMEDVFARHLRLVEEEDKQERQDEKKRRLPQSTEHKKVFALSLLLFLSLVLMN